MPLSRANFALSFRATFAYHTGRLSHSPAAGEHTRRAMAATPRQSIEAAPTAQGTPDSRSSGEKTEKPTPSEPISEKVELKVADANADVHLDLQKLDSKTPKSFHGDAGADADPFAGLDPNEATILRRQVDTPDVKVGFATLYRYSTRMDLILLFIGSVCSIASGAILPLMTVVFGSLQGTFAGFFNGSASYDSFTHEMVHLVLYFVYLGIGMFFTTYIATVVFIYTGEHIAGKIREHYLESCLKQNIVSPILFAQRVAFTLLERFLARTQEC